MKRQLAFTEQDFANAVKYPEMMQQVVSHVNHVTLLVTNLDEIRTKWGMTELRFSTIENDIDFLRNLSKTLTEKEEFNAFRSLCKAQHTQTSSRLTQFDDRMLELEELQRLHQAQQARLQQMEDKLETQNQLLEKLQGTAAEHAGALSRTAQTLEKHSEHLKRADSKLEKEVEERETVAGQQQIQLDRKAMAIEELGRRMAHAASNIQTANEEIKECRNFVVQSVAEERKKTEEGLDSLDRQLGVRMTQHKNNLLRTETSLRSTVKAQDDNAKSILQQSADALSNRISRGLSDVDHQIKAIQQRIESEKFRGEERNNTTMVRCREMLQETQTTLNNRCTLLEQEVRVSVKVFGKAVQDMTPTIEAIVREQTFDMLQISIRKESEELRGLLASKVSQEEAREELKKKADSLTLTAYASKKQVSALVSEAVRMEARQMASHVTAALEEAKEGWMAADPHRLDDTIFLLQSENIRLQECVNELYQLLKSSDEDATARANQQSRRVFRGSKGKPVAMLAKTLLPVTVAHAQAAHLPPYMHLKSPRPASVQVIAPSDGSARGLPSPVIRETSRSAEGLVSESLQRTASDDEQGRYIKWEQREQTGAGKRPQTAHPNMRDRKSVV